MASSKAAALLGLLLIGTLSAQAAPADLTASGRKLLQTPAPSPPTGVLTGPLCAAGTLLCPLSGYGLFTANVLAALACCPASSPCPAPGDVFAPFVCTVPAQAPPGTPTTAPAATLAPVSA